MTDIDSFSSADGVNPPASSAESTSVNSQNDVSTGSDLRVNLTADSVNSQSGMTRSDADKRGVPAQRLMDAAHDMHNAGINVVPVKEDGSKRPDLPRWTKYQSQRTTGDQLFSWFASSQLTGIGCIYGAISGNTEMLEFEGRAIEEGLLDEITELMEGSGFGSVWEAITTGWVDQSPSGGMHFRFRVEGAPVKGNTKLASREAEEHELTDDERALKQRKPNKIIYRTLVETRGEGGFGVCAPSHGKVHDTGRPYVRLHGGPGTIPVIDAETYEAIHHICQTVDRSPREEAPQWRGRPLPELPEGQLRPGDDYNQRGDIGELLQQHGWTFVYQRGPTSYWCRPGKNKGISASYNYRESGRFYVFTSSTEFNENRAYTPFTAYTVLECGGNFKNAAKALGRQGYGTRLPIPSPRMRAEDPSPYDRWATEKQDANGHIVSREAAPDPAGAAASRAEEAAPADGGRTADTRLPAIHGTGRLLTLNPGSPFPVAEHLRDEFFLHEGKPTLMRWQDMWVRWDGACWSVISDSDVEAWLYQRMDRAYFKKINDDGTAEFADWNPNGGTVLNLRKALQAAVNLRDDTLQRTMIGSDEDILVIPCTNGLLDARTRELSPLNPAYFTFSSVPFAYDQNAGCPQWIAWLEAMFAHDPATIGMIQEWFGYVVSGRTDQQKAFAIVGPERSGKGTIAWTLQQVVGMANCCGPTLNSLTENFGMWSLTDKTLAVIGDARLPKKGTEVITERLLSVIGEDTLQVDRKYQRPWQGRIPARIMLLSNEIPNWADTSGVLPTRFIVATTTISYLNNEDTTLKDRIAAELPGILNWALEGLDRITRQGKFTVNEATPEIVSAQRERSAPQKGFIEEVCFLSEDAWVTKDRLRQLWIGWNVAHGRMVNDTRESFTTKLLSMVPTVKARDCKKRVDGKLTPIYKGIGVAADYLTQQELEFSAEVS